MGSRKGGLIKMDEWIGSTWFAGRKYVVTPLLIKPRRVKARGKEYIQHMMYIPCTIAKTLYSLAERNPEEELPILALITPATWFHVLNWKQEPIHAYKQLPRKIKLELEALGLSPLKEMIAITTLTTPTKIKELGLDPSKPITLEELEKKILEKHKEKIPVSQPA